MKIVMLVIMVGGILILFCIYILFRNIWVYTKRLEINKKCYKEGDWTEYNKLLSYDNMMKKWWCWDITKLVR